MIRKPLVVGVLTESKNIWEKRAPLTPEDVKWFIKRGVPVEVASSPLRIFRDTLYRQAGARIVSNFQKAKLLVGIKEPPIPLIPNSIYMVFSHTTKGQPQNRNLLKAFLHKKITLTDYEHLVDPSGERLVYFGWSAGICGMIA